MNIDKDIGFVHNSFSSIPSNKTIQVVGTGAFNVALATCTVDGVLIDSTNNRGLTLLVFNQDMILQNRYRYDTLTNPNALAANGLPSMKDVLVNIPLNWFFAIYSFERNTQPSSYDITGIPSGVPSGQVHINDLFKNMRAVLWSKIKRIQNNNEEFRPYACFGVGTKSTSNYPTITHESLGTTKNVPEPHARLSACVPLEPGNALTLGKLNKVSERSNTKLLPLNSNTYYSDFFYTGGNRYGIRLSIGTSLKVQGTNNRSETINIYIRRKSDSVMVYGKSINTCIYKTFNFDIPLPYNNTEYRITIEKTTVSSIYIQHCAVYEKLLYDPSSVGINKNVMFASGFFASNTGFDLTDANAIYNTDGVPICNTNTSILFASGLVPARQLNSGTHDVGLIPIDFSRNYVIHMIKSGAANRVTISTYDSDDNLIDGIKIVGETYQNTIALDYPGSHSPSPNELNDTTLYISDKIINIPIYSYNSQNMRACFIGKEAEDLPSINKPILQFNNNVQKIKIAVTRTGGTPVYYYGKLFPMAVGIKDNGNVYGSINVG